MAEESGGGSWWDGWGNDFLENIKAKSTETMAMVKQDLSEFMCTVHGDTTCAIADTAIAVKDQLKVNEQDQDSTSGRLKQGMSDWFGTISSTLKDNISQVTNTAAASFSEPDSPVFDRFQAHLSEIQTDPTTYCSEPDGHPRLYDEWCERFDLEQSKAEISELLVNKPKVRALYTNLVPSAVSHSLFWQRYFYKVHQLNQEEKRRAALVERANKVTEEDLGWGDEDDDLWGGNVEGSSADNVIELHTDNQSSENVAAAIHGDAEDGEKACDAGPSLSHTDICGKIEKGPLEKTVCAQRSDENRNASLSILTPTIEAESSIALPISEKASQPECNSSELEKQSYQKVVQAEISSEDEARVSPISEKESQPECDSSELEKQPIQQVVQAECSGEARVSPTTEKESQPKCDSSELEKQPIQQVVQAESFEESKVSPTTEQTRQPECDSSELEKLALTRDEADSSSFEKPTELPVNSDEQSSSHQRASSTGSVDSSWSKLSEEANDGKAKPSLSKSSSSSSGVLVPSVDDKDIEWENDMDLDEDISEEEMKKIIESLGNKDLSKLGDLELDDADWDNWE